MFTNKIRLSNDSLYNYQELRETVKKDLRPFKELQEDLIILEKIIDLADKKQ